MSYLLDCVSHLLFESKISWQWYKTISSCVLCHWLGAVTFPLPLRRKQPVTGTNRDLLQCSSVLQHVPPAPIREVEMEKALQFRACKKCSGSFWAFPLLSSSGTPEKGFKAWKETSHWNSEHRIQSVTKVGGTDLTGVGTGPDKVSWNWNTRQC